MNGVMARRSLLQRFDGGGKFVEFEWLTGWVIIIVLLLIIIPLNSTCSAQSTSKLLMSGVELTLAKCLLRRVAFSRLEMAG